MEIDSNLIWLVLGMGVIYWRLSLLQKEVREHIKFEDFEQRVKVENELYSGEFPDLNKEVVKRVFKIGRGAVIINRDFDDKNQIEKRRIYEMLHRWSRHGLCELKGNNKWFFLPVFWKFTQKPKKFQFTWLSRLKTSIYKSSLYPKQHRQDSEIIKGESNEKEKEEIGEE